MVVTDVITPQPRSQLRTFVKDQSQQEVLRCYQCGKCTAGCPIVYAMDLTPRQIMRAIQFGLKDEVLNSKTIWLCFSCLTCSARCPREIDIARIMESLRFLAIQEKVKPAEKDIQLFHRLFLSLIQRWGHIYELGLGALYNMQSRHFLAKVKLLPAMLRRGKLAILPHRVKAASEIRRILARIKETT